MQIAYFERINSFLACSGQPREDNFSAIASAGYDIVINLASPNSIGYLPNERELVESNGLKYHHLPVQWDSPQVYDVLKFFALMNNYRDKRIWVHCTMNNSASSFVYFYRKHILEEPEESARVQMNKYCDPTPAWNELIDQVDALHP